MAAKFLDELAENTKRDLMVRTKAGRVRFFEKPTWESAQESVIKKKKGVQIQQRDIERAFFGRYSGIGREGKNTPHQGGNADIAKAAMPAIVALCEKYGAEEVNFVHDEFVVECPKEHAEAVSDGIGQAIIDAGATILTRVKMNYEGGIAEYWKK